MTESASLTSPPLTEDFSEGRSAGQSGDARPASLAETHARLAAIIETSSDAIISGTAEHISTWNRAAERTYGYTAAEAIGKPLALIVPPDRLLEIRAVLTRIQAGKEVSSFETVWMHRNGERIDIALTLSPVKNAAGQVVEFSAISRDITEQSRAHRRMQESEAKLALAQRITHLGSWELDLDQPDALESGHLHWSDETFRIFGYEPGCVEVTRKLFLDAIHPSDQAAVRHAVTAAVNHGQPYQVVHRIILPDGSERIVSERAHIFYDLGRPVKMVGTVQDITEQTRAQRLLRDSEERYRTLAKAISQIIWRAGADGITRGPSPDWQAFTGQTEAQVQGLGWMDALHPDDLAQVRLDWSSAVQNKQLYRTEYRARRHDGEYRHFITRGAPVLMEDGSIREWIGTCSDITERRRAEDELFRSKQMLGYIVEQIPQRVFWKDRQSVMMGCSRAMAHDAGQNSPDECVGKTDYDFSWHSSAALFRADDAAVMESGEPKINYVEPMKMHDGSIRWLNTNKVPLYDRDGQICGVIGTYEDITDRHNAEQEIRRLNNDLEQRVQERTAQFESANRELEAFTYSVSHDLRAPLRAISGFARILKIDLREQLPVEAREYLDLIQSNTQQMGRLVDDLLAFSRLGRQPLTKRPVVTRELVDQSLRDLAHEFGTRTIQVTIGELPRVEADSTLLKQVFVNLISNAVKYTQKRDCATIEIGTLDGSVFFVRDNGVGFDMRYVHKLFGVFQRLHRAEDYEGTGVGLAIVERIVKRHGGRVWAEAVVNSGATFFFTLS